MKIKKKRKAASLRTRSCQVDGSLSDNSSYDMQDEGALLVQSSVPPERVSSACPNSVPSPGTMPSPGRVSSSSNEAGDAVRVADKSYVYDSSAAAEVDEEDNINTSDSEYINEDSSDSLFEPSADEQVSTIQEDSDDDAITRPSKRSRIDSHRDHEWHRRLEELRNFKARHGHCRVPSDFGRLHEWLHHQQSISLNKKSSLCIQDALVRKRRTQELESILGTRLTSWSSSHHQLDHSLSLSDSQLSIPVSASSSEENGEGSDTEESQLSFADAEEDDISACAFESMFEPDLLVRNFREETDTHKSSKQSLSGNSRRMARSSKQRRATRNNIETWNGRLEELKAFKIMNGHCRVPESHRPLHNWLHHQRYVMLNPKHPRHLRDTSERKRRTRELESILGSNPQKPIWYNKGKWDARLEELKKFKLDHGHCRVPKSYSESLYQWVKKQSNRELNPRHSRHLQDSVERTRRTKALEAVLGENLDDWRNWAEE